MSTAGLEAEFPSLLKEGYRITSPESSEYNCFAWAVSDTKRWWSPSPDNGYHWPSDIPATVEVSSFLKLYGKEGFAACENHRSESGFEKLAIYCDADGEVTHVARQLKSGVWTSKLGDWEDIEHRTLAAIEGDMYGYVVQILRRKFPR